MSNVDTLFAICNVGFLVVIFGATTASIYGIVVVVQAIMELHSKTVIKYYDDNENEVDYDERVYVCTEKYNAFGKLVKRDMELDLDKMREEILKADEILCANK